MMRLGTMLALCSVFVVTNLHAREPWVTLKDCQYVANDSNDGDSFHVRSGRKEYIFRLYFVDSPETDSGLRERVDEQAKYFGVSVSQTIEIGEAAKNFVRERLSRPFVVRTCMQDAMGRSKMERLYAFVEVDRRDLGEELVANGLARLHGTVSQPPGMVSPEIEWQKLEQLERTAKLQKVGAWGVNAGRLNARVQSRQQSAADSFDAFFHPERLRATPTPTAASNPALSLPAASVSHNTPRSSVNIEVSVQKKLDVNAASAQELDALPGIGLVLAGRIIAARPFKSADDLRRVKGIGAKKYEKIRPFFR